MNTNITISLDTRRPKDDGSYPIILRISHRRSNASILLGYYVREADWDEKKRQIRKKCTTVDSVTRVNNLLTKKKAAALDVITRLNDAGVLQGMTPGAIKKNIQGISEAKQEVVVREDFYSFTDSLILQMRQAKQIGNARVYDSTKACVRNFQGKKELFFEQIDYRYLMAFEADYRSRGNKTNGLSHYMRTIRAIYNKAIKAGIVAKSLYPFDDYKIKNEPTRKRAIQREPLLKIVKQDLDETHPCFHARNFFLASYEMYGMSFIDMAFLKVGDITAGRIRYQRTKSGRLYDIAVTKHLGAILEYYTVDKPAQEFMFPIVKREKLEDQYRDIKWARKRYNAALRKLGELCGIEERLTSYVSRHSFATQAMLGEIPLKAISQMLGHKSLTTTQIYLDSLPSTVLDQYHSRTTLDS